MRFLYVVRWPGPVAQSVRGVSGTEQAGLAKKSAIALALLQRGHEVYVLSDIALTERSLRWKPPLVEKLALSTDRHVSIHYPATWDASVLGLFVGGVTTVHELSRLGRDLQFDGAIVYNCYLSSLTAALYCDRVLKIPVILEYEDRAQIRRGADSQRWRSMFGGIEHLMKGAISGVIGASPELAAAADQENAWVLPGTVADDLARAGLARTTFADGSQRLKLLYAGQLEREKGPDLLLAAAELVDAPLELHICGFGSLEHELREACAGSKHPAHFHGSVSRERLVELLTTVDIGVCPHRQASTPGAVWPFKIAEYLAGCGTVVCSRTGVIERALEAKLRIYEDGADEAEALAGTLRSTIADWQVQRRAAPQNIRWANDSWGVPAIGAQIERMFERSAS